MPPRFTPILSIIFAAAAGSPAVAQAIPLRHAKPIEIQRSCAREIQRFCPDLAGTGQSRNQVICLKPFRIDLALPCHRAINAALR